MRLYSLMLSYELQRTQLKIETYAICNGAYWGCEVVVAGTRHVIFGFRLRVGEHFRAKQIFLVVCDYVNRF